MLKKKKKFSLFSPFIFSVGIRDSFVCVSHNLYNLFIDLAISLLSFRIVHYGAHFIHWCRHLRIKLVCLSNGTTKIFDIDFCSLCKTGLFHGIWIDPMHFGDVWKGWLLHENWLIAIFLIIFFFLSSFSLAR